MRVILRYAQQIRPVYWESIEIVPAVCNASWGAGTWNFAARFHKPRLQIARWGSDCDKVDALRYSLHEYCSLASIGNILPLGNLAVYQSCMRTFDITQNLLVRAVDKVRRAWDQHDVPRRAYNSDGIAFPCVEAPGCRGCNLIHTWINGGYPRRGSIIEYEVSHQEYAHVLQLRAMKHPLLTKYACIGPYCNGKFALTTSATYLFSTDQVAMNAYDVLNGMYSFLLPFCVDYSC